MTGGGQSRGPGTPSQSQIQRDCAILEATLIPLPFARQRALLIALVGLPASGKTFLARALSARQPLVHLESDRLRAVLFRKPTHRYKESRRLFRAIHALAASYLSQGHVVVLDATNLREEHRQDLVDIGQNCAARVLLVEVTAPEGLIVQRLKGREHHPGQAGVEVYTRMRAEAEPIRLEHRSVDTSRDISEAINLIAGEIEEL